MTEGGVSPIPSEARQYQGQRAGLVTRLVAAAIDGILVGLVLLLGYAGFAGLLFLIDPRGFSFPEMGLFLSLSSAFVVLVIYLTVSWWISGRTYGALVMGLRVVGHRGENMRLLGALVRAVLCGVFPVGLLWAAVNKENRSVQDVLLLHVRDLRLAAEERAPDEPRHPDREVIPATPSRRRATRSDQRPVTASSRPLRMASRKTEWSRSVWSAYPSA